MNYLWILQVYRKKKKKKVFTQTGWTLAATACTGRGLTAGRHWADPVAQPRALRVGDVGGGSVKYASPREGRTFRCPSPLKRAGPAHRVADEWGPGLWPSPTSRSNRAEAGEARLSGAGTLPGGTGHLRRRPAHRRTQRTAAYPSMCCTPTGEPGKRRDSGAADRG